MSAAEDTAAAPANPASANPARGETTLAVGDQPLTVRPSFQSLVSAEQEVGSLFALVEKAASGTLTLGDTIALVWHCIVDRPDAITREKLGELVIEAGITVLTPVLRKLLGQIVKGL